MENPVEVGDGVSADPERPPGFVRKPFGNRDQKLAYPSRPGYHRHWFNDDPGRVMQAEAAGYVHVTTERGDNVKMVVGIGRGGQPQVAFLMEVRQEWFDEDMAAQDQAVVGLMTEIGRGDFERPSGRDGAVRYSGTIDIRSAPGVPGNRR